MLSVMIIQIFCRKSVKCSILVSFMRQVKIIAWHFMFYPPAFVNNRGFIEDMDKNVRLIG